MRISALLVVGALLSTSASAQNATPNHVFQTVETVRLQLAAYNEANFSSPKNDVAVEVGILPRHVYQYAERVLEKVQLLRFMNGLSTDAPNASPVKDIKPADVNNLAQTISAQVNDMAAAHGVQTVPTPDLPAGKKPADVYANLVRLSQSMDALGVPATVPNDVYRTAQT